MDIQLFEQLLEAAVKSGASDIHLKVGSPFTVRDEGQLQTVMEEKLKPEDINMIVRKLLGPAAAKYHSKIDLENLDTINDLDTSYSLPGVGRFRANVYRQRGTLAVTLRVISQFVPDIDDLQLPPVLKEIATEQRGLVLVTGTTGCGKSTTLAAMIEYVNRNSAKKIVTIEDPIEFLISDKASNISQREIGCDSSSFATALRAALRQDPDIIMVGEMRDRETTEIAITAAETGHLVFSTGHAQNADGTILRLLGVFNAAEQGEIKIRLVDTLRAIVSQRLLPRKSGEGRIAAVEIMRMTGAIRERILPSDPRGLSDLIEQGRNPYQMQTFDQHLTDLYKKEIISLETSMAAATSPTNFKRNLMFEDT